MNNTELISLGIVGLVAIIEAVVICYLARVAAAGRISRDGYDFRQAMTNKTEAKPPKPKAKVF